MSKWTKVGCVVSYLAIWSVLILVFLPIVVFLIKIWWGLTKMAWEVVL